jgi:peptidoglycan/xylan/chitin deacetylase (PgdA/CDA1 family)
MNLTISRRHLLQTLAAGAAIGGVPAYARDRTPGIAITIDDFDLADTPLISGLARDAAIRAALRSHGVKGAGFVAGKFVDAEKSPHVLAAWSSDGHMLGNHSFSHPYFDGSDPAAEMADILKCEALLAPYPGFRKAFRYPYLAEGNTRAGRDALRRLLREHGYRPAPVTIDTSDWYIDQRLTTRLKEAPATDLSGYRAYWLAHIWDRATYYDGLARALLGHSISHTILLHHRLTTGLFLDDGLTMFRDRGWRLVDASTALATPELQRQYDVVPAGQSLMWAAAKASGRYEGKLRYPGEDDRYEKPGMDALGL